jgi:N6-adenosine-specific RNA methylase IME4
MPYPTMTAEELRDFGSTVEQVAADDCHLYLWTTHSQLWLARELAEHWGFRYECVLTWVKSGGPTPLYSFMRTTEFVLFCRRGKLPLAKVGLPAHFAANRTGHSVKPDAFFDLVREVSPGPRLELFARAPHDGFTAWGNEVAECQDAAG